MVKETFVSYYGLTYPEHAKRDFQDMLDHNCNAVLLAITEFDMHFWYPNVIKIASLAKEMGLKTYLNLWGIGKFFGGEQVSLFLQNNIKNRQVSANTGQPLPAACITSKAFNDYFLGLLEKLAKEAEADGFFWDEPHYELPAEVGKGQDWTCRCEICQQTFLQEYGYDMPKVLTSDVIKFRRDKAKEILIKGARTVKDIRPEVEVTICVLPRQENYYVPDYRGYGDWEEIAEEELFDVFATSIMDPESSWRDFKEVAERTVELAHSNGKKAQRWIMNYFRVPDNLEDIKKLARIYAEAGVDSIGAWTYKGGKGTILAANGSDEIAQKAWDTLGEAYGEVRGNN